MPKKAENKTEETRVELSHTAAPDEVIDRNEADSAEAKRTAAGTKRAETKRAGQGSNETVRPTSSVDGKNRTQRKAPAKGKANTDGVGAADALQGAKPKRRSAKPKVEFDHTTLYTPKEHDPVSGSLKRDKAKRAEAERAGLGQAEPNRASWIPGKGAYESAREMLDNSMERDLIAREPGYVPKKPQNPQEMMVKAAAESPTGDMLEASIDVYNLPRIDICDADAVHKRLEEFFRIYAGRGLRPTVAGMAMSLGIDRRRLWEIRTGKYEKGDRRVGLLPQNAVDEIKKAYDIMENLWEGYMLSGKLNPVSGIYIGRNQFGYLDRINYEVNVPMEEAAPSVDDIRRRYMTADEGSIETDFADGN